MLRSRFEIIFPKETYITYSLFTLTYHFFRARKGTKKPRRVLPFGETEEWDLDAFCSSLVKLWLYDTEILPQSPSKWV